MEAYRLDNHGIFYLVFLLMIEIGNRKEQLREYCSEHGEMLFTVFTATAAGIALVIAII